MANMNINITGLDTIAQAINNLAQALGKGGVMQYQQPFTGQAGQGALPTTATTQSYTQDQIAIALTGLIDQGKRDYVMQILGQFGAMSLMQVPVERYPELVTQLRGAGANI